MTDLSQPKWPQTTIKASSYLKGRIGWHGLKASEFTDHGPYLITGTDFQDGRIEWSTCYHVTEERFQEGVYIHIRDGDLLITKDGTIGKVAYVTACPTKAVLNSGIFLVRCSDGSYDHRFLYHLLQSHPFDTFLRLHLAGSTINHLYQNVFERFDFPIPDIRVQRRFADILDSIDGQIRQTEELIAKYQQIKAGLMYDLFTRGVTPDGHLRSTRDQAPHLYRQSPLGWIPAEWEVAKLRDKSAPGRPHIKTGPFGSSLKGEHWVEHGHPVITIGALGEGELLSEGLLFVSEATAQRLREYQLESGDVVFSRVADVGRSAVICKQHDGWIMSSNLMRISLDRNLVAPSYLQSQFAFDFKVNFQIRTKVNSGGRDVANGQILNQLLFAWPRRDEQEIAMQRMTTIDANRRGLAAQRAKLVKLKHGLMQDLLTGRVRVKVEGSEVA